MPETKPFFSVRAALLSLAMRILDAPRPLTARELFDVWARQGHAAFPEQAWANPHVRQAWHVVAMAAGRGARRG